MATYEKDILGRLLDAYERSATYRGASKVRQRFSVRPAEVAPAYADDARIEVFRAFNEAAGTLANAGLVTLARKRNGVIERITLCEDALDGAYRACGREPKRGRDAALSALLSSYRGKNDVLDAYIADQLARVAANKPVRNADDLQEYESILRVLASVYAVEEETFQRDFSVRTLGDSKAFEAVCGKVRTILLKYGDFSDEDTVFEELNIVRNPGHVYFKGEGRICLDGQWLDFSGLAGDFAISSALLPCVTQIEVLGAAVITIENLTTFNAFHEPGFFAVYLGGYHNSLRRAFIKKLYEQNQNREYFHWGDIDAGGFRILEHLRVKTDVPFIPYRMDAATLLANRAWARPLTARDRTRLEAFLGGEFDEVVRVMLAEGIKLEQEALD